MALALRYTSSIETPRIDFSIKGKVSFPVEHHYHHHSLLFVSFFAAVSFFPTATSFDNKLTANTVFELVKDIITSKNITVAKS